MATFVTEDQWSAIRKDLRGTRAPVTAVVAYVGDKGDTLMPLKRGDRLVCEASDALIASGFTDARTLQRFAKHGVEIYSKQGLHAKVVVGDGFAWVGSANASGSGYLEAVVRVGQTDARRIAAWADALCIEPFALSVDDLQRLAAIEVKRRQAPPPQAPKSRTLSDVGQLSCLWLGNEASRAAEKAASVEKEDVKAVSSRVRGMAGWQWIEWPGSGAPAEGEWILPIRSGRVGRPGFVERVSVHPRFNLIWYRELAVSTRPTQAELAADVVGWHEWDARQPLRLDAETTAEVLARFE